jgi:hypothetical protein
VDEIVEQKCSFGFEPSFVKFEGFGRGCSKLLEELVDDSAEDILGGIFSIMLKEKVGYQPFEAVGF